jgi:hypothetical protein
MMKVFVNKNADVSTGVFRDQTASVGRISAAPSPLPAANKKAGIIAGLLSAHKPVGFTPPSSPPPAPHQIRHNPRISQSRHIPK